MAREIINAGLHNETFIRRATTGFDAYRAHVEPFTLEEGERITGVPAAMIREAAHAFARAGRAMICWTLGITEHHNGVDNVLSLINLGLLCGHVGRYGSGLNPLRGQNNVQGGGDMGAIPNKLPGFQDIVSDHDARARFEAAWGTPIRPAYGLHLTEMFHAMEEGDLRTLWVIGENPAQSEADINRTRKLLGDLDFLVVQDIFLTRTAELADVVLPGTASWCESEGTVTNSERRVQRVRKALDPPGDARDDSWIIAELARRLGHDWGERTGEQVWDELRSLSPMHAGMRYDRLEALGGIQWPCPDEDHPGTSILHERLWQDPVEGRLAPFSPTVDQRPFEALDATYPIRLTTGRRLESYNTGAQTGRYTSPLHRGESLDLSPEDAATLGVTDGERVRVSSRRGAVEAPVRIDVGLRTGLAFMTFHFPDEVDVNQLTIDATDPVSGTAEFKACAIRVDRLEQLAPTGD
jgi:formate dehydrogenase major subunit